MESGEAGLQETIKRALTLTTHERWLSVQAEVLEGMNKLPAKALALISEGQSSEEAQLETRLEGFDIQARAYLTLVSDLPTFSAYLAYLRLLVRGERKKVERTVWVDPKPEGINEEFWNYLISKNSKAIETVYDPLGDQITWFENAIIERFREWNAKAYRRAADLGLANDHSSATTTQVNGRLAMTADCHENQAPAGELNGQPRVSDSAGSSRQPREHRAVFSGPTRPVQQAQKPQTLAETLEQRQLPEELNKLISATEQIDVKKEILRLEARLQKRDEQAVRDLEDYRYLNLTFDIIARKLQNQPDFELMLHQKIPGMVQAIRIERRWWPNADVETLTRSFLGSSILEWQLQAEESKAITAEYPSEPLGVTGAMLVVEAKCDAREAKKSRKRGRPQTIPIELKQKALATQGNRERAKILYGTPYPSIQQVKNVHSILRNYLKSSAGENVE